MTVLHPLRILIIRDEISIFALHVAIFEQFAKPMECIFTVPDSVIKRVRTGNLTAGHPVITI
ncbi:hypothetical protein BM613_07680 [Sulfoacidibacillus thermotolerans]|uniref:Uncharacterized protein n=1 Tax=Sulfoacidibacillus thermotolerans TaxID=1765684 RepID=A0A2U3D8R4_SULT2|nr:hypothetical protein BM613_07680 [Sulfoacidibacillus thermotolerans]